MKLRWLALGLCLPAMLSFYILVMVKPTHSQEVNNQKAGTNELGLVKNHVDLIRLNGKKVKLVGYYTSQSRKPSPTQTGIINFKGLYIKSQIVLEDGIIISIFPSGNKESLRSASEADKYRGQIVEAIGVVAFEATSNINYKARESFINLEKLQAVKLENSILKSSVEMESVGVRRQKPPHAKLLFNISLRNHHQNRRWFLFPKVIMSDLKPKIEGIERVEIFEHKGKGKAIVTHFIGIGSFYALLLPADAEIKLRNFPISFWGELPPELPVEFIAASNLTIDGKAAEEYLGINPISSVQADVAEEGREIGNFKGKKKLSISTSEEESIKLYINLVEK
jgi:hypothetical protein